MTREKSLLIIIVIFTPWTRYAITKFKRLCMTCKIQRSWIFTPSLWYETMCLWCKIKLCTWINRCISRKWSWIWLLLISWRKYRIWWRVIDQTWRTYCIWVGRQTIGAHSLFCSGRVKSIIILIVFHSNSLTTTITIGPHKFLTIARFTLPNICTCVRISIHRHLCTPNATIWYTSKWCIEFTLFIFSIKQITRGTSWTSTLYWW